MSGVEGIIPVSGVVSVYFAICADDAVAWCVLIISNLFKSGRNTKKGTLQLLLPFTVVLVTRGALTVGIAAFDSKLI